MKKIIYRLAIFLLRISNVQTLKHCYELVGVVAKEINQSYFSIEIRMLKGEQTYSGYINTLNFVSGNTIEEVCNGLRKLAKKDKPVKKKTIITS